MSSHREAPEIAKDPVADSTDLYAFVSPDRPDTVTLIANYVPLQAPDGGPNFYEFGDDVLYAINIDNDGDGDADISYQFQFTSEITDPNTFLYNTGPITSLTSPSWNRRQTYSVTRVDGSGAVSSGRASRARRATSDRCPRPTSRHWWPRPSPLPRGRRSSPASGPRASTSTSAPSSTSATSGRSSRTTPPSAWPVPDSARWPRGSTPRRGSTSTASPSRSRSPS